MSMFQRNARVWINNGIGCVKEGIVEVEIWLVDEGIQGVYCCNKIELLKGGVMMHDLVDLALLPNGSGFGQWLALNGLGLVELAYFGGTIEML